MLVIMNFLIKNIILCLLILSSSYLGWWASSSYENGDLRRMIFNSSLGQKYFLVREEKRSFKLTEGSVECPNNNYLGIATFGQSHLSNVSLRKEPIDLSSQNVLMYDWVSGKCYPYKEPLVGTTGSFNINNYKDQISGEELFTKYPYIGGNIMSPLIQKIRGIGYQKKIVVGAFAVGGSSAFYWSNGAQLSRLNKFLETSKKNNMNFDIFLWHQGSTDSIPRLYKHHSSVEVGSKLLTKYNLYKSSLEKIFIKVKNFYPDTKIGIAISSICNSSWITEDDGSQVLRHFVDEEIAEAQRSVSSKSDDYFISAETNDLLGKYLWDGCHYYPKGEDIITSRYLDNILLNLKLYDHVKK